MDVVQRRRAAPMVLETPAVSEASASPALSSPAFLKLSKVWLLSFAFFLFFFSD